MQAAWEAVSQRLHRTGALKQLLIEGPGIGAGCNRCHSHGGHGLTVYGASTSTGHSAVSLQLEAAGGKTCSNSIDAGTERLSMA